MFKGAIFDIDGTLYDYKENDIVAVKSLCRFAEEKLDVSEKKFCEVYGEARRIVKTRLANTGGSQHSRVLFLQTALELLGKNPFLYVTKMYDAYWNPFLENMQPFDGVVDFMKSLKAAGIKIAVCTDMTAHIQYRKLARLGLDKFIDFMVTSEETGLEKPASIMFELALSKLETKPEETVYFGDSLERDIEGAAKVGINPFWFISDREVEKESVPCKKFRSYRDLKNFEEMIL